MIKKTYYACYKTIIILAVCLLAACSQIPQQQESARSPEQIQAMHSRIANNFLKQSLQASSKAEMQDYKLKAAENFILANDVTKAAETIKNVEITSQTQESYLFILKAQIALQQNKLENAQQDLQHILAPQQLAEALQIKFYQTRSQLHLRTDNNVAAAQDNIALEPFLKNRAQMRAKSKEIWHILSKLTPKTLQDLQQQNNDNNFQGWLNFTYIMKQYDTNSEQMSRALAIWQQTFPDHLANNILPNSSRSYGNDGAINQPKNIALLLPLTGPYAPSAEIIRDGFLAAHYEAMKNNFENKSEVKIYDTSTPEGVTQAYQKAVAENADFIVGPLIKNDVEILANIANSHMPVLALNTVPASSHTRNANFFQFGLLPETDAVELAEQAWHDGHRRVIVLVPAGDWGHRIAAAFRSHWDAHRGQILAIEKFTPKDDLNQKMRAILMVDKKELRIKQLKAAGLEFSHEPHRRQDVDAIILASTPVIARQIKPLLNFYYANNIPVYAHSSVYSGQVAEVQDQDLNGVIFCDMPWVLDGSVVAKAIYRNIASLWPSKLAQSPRLFAFGIDAYQIANQMHRLKMLPDFGISGMTGVLTLDKSRTIQRKLMWAKFENGSPKLLATR